MCYNIDTKTKEKIDMETIKKYFSVFISGERFDYYKVNDHYELWTGETFICSGDTDKELDDEIKIIAKNLRKKS
jgi:hypothetical protein